MKPCDLAVPDLEELLAEEIPCGGIHHPAIARSCTKAAVLRSTVHGCTSRTALESSARNKCVACWQVWYQYHVNKLMRCGFLRCWDCKQTFYSIEAFSDYRPL